MWAVIRDIRYRRCEKRGKWEQDGMNESVGKVFLGGFDSVGRLDERSWVSRSHL